LRLGNALRWRYERFDTESDAEDVLQQYQLALGLCGAHETNRSVVLTHVAPTCNQFYRSTGNIYHLEEAWKLELGAMMKKKSQCVASNMVERRQQMHPHAPREQQQE